VIKALYAWFPNIKQLNFEGTFNFIYEYPTPMQGSLPSLDTLNLNEFSSNYDITHIIPKFSCLFKEIYSIGYSSQSILNAANFIKSKLVANPK
jgi:hypothetical protein